MKITSIVNLKGGVGKTTLTNNIAGVLSNRGLRVLICDMDHQGNLTMIHKEADTLPEMLEIMRQRGGMTKVLLDDVALAGVIESTANPGIKIATADMGLVHLERFGNSPKAMHKLSLALRSVADQFDHTLIDCPPFPGVGTQMAFTASDQYLIPLNAHPFSYIGALKIQEVAGEIREYGGNNSLDFLGYVICRVQTRRKLSDSMIHFFREEFGSQVLPTEVKESTVYGEATSMGKTMADYDEKSDQAKLIEQLVDELKLDTTPKHQHQII